eukprot:scaffold65458_cov45-Phaeocystis_antarctica.AAC.1
MLPGSNAGWIFIGRKVRSVNVRASRQRAAVRIGQDSVPRLGRGCKPMDQARKHGGPGLPEDFCVCVLTARVRWLFDFQTRNVDDGASSLCGISRFQSAINVYASGAHHFGRSRL